MWLQYCDYNIMITLWQHYDNIMLITLWWSQRKYVKDSSPRLIESDAKSLASLAPRYPTIFIYIVICLSSAPISSFFYTFYIPYQSFHRIYPTYSFIFFIFLSSQINSDHISSPALEQQVSQATAGNRPSQVRSQPTQVRSASIMVIVVSKMLIALRLLMALMMLMM